MSSPVMTTITTHPIGQLNFPTVTVCPPKGSNTALNYDLMRLQNRTLSTEDRDFLSKEIKKAFVNEGHRRFVDKMLFSSLKLASRHSIQTNMSRRVFSFWLLHYCMHSVT